MNDSWPDHFTRLAPFRELFRRGAPILTYHKFGPRPPRVRLKGLYLPTRLLGEQLRELRDAGLESASVPAALSRSPGSCVVLTIDDGFRSVVREALPLLQQYRMAATLYLVADRLGGWNDWEQAQGEAPAPLMEKSEVREWLAAGQRIGAHTLTHPWLTRLPLAAADEEITASRKRLEDGFGVPVRDFCYPYGDWNEAVRDQVVAAGYETAVTTEFGVNPAGTDPWALRRITARHASRGWRSVVAWWRRKRASRANGG